MWRQQIPDQLFASYSKVATTVELLIATKVI